MLIEANRDEISSSYQDVRSDSSDTNWVIYKYEGNDLKVSNTGVDYSEFLDCFKTDDRAYAYLRIQSGDELSKRMKFVFITWIGSDVSPLKKAKMSTDKGFVKNIISACSVEVNAETIDDICEKEMKSLVAKAGGACYGTGK